MYRKGEIKIIAADYVSIAFSDHMGLVVEIRVPKAFSRLLSPEHKTLFKAKPDVVLDPIFKERLKTSMGLWKE